ncbi:hypothetical protein [Nocardiopsis sp. JB363]|uniref:hypothetical protein n=1 Tax=Nocardiopsis sp. JB363 TaxID=1434837 RepID=UPI000979DE9B|nr:hypothetical protein [Nocardiopsis sp. JB363]SIO86472.1 hypothetical protein BQ8420_12175 [Nocardiopsis sp. JB363]
MNVVWLRPRPRPDRPEEHLFIDAATIRGLRVQPLPWQETRRDQPHRRVLHALVSGQRAPVELMRGEHQDIAQTAAEDLARILATERGHFDREGGGVIITCGQETPEGVLFHVERTGRPDDVRDWWPKAYRARIEQQQAAARAEARVLSRNPLDDLALDVEPATAVPARNGSWPRNWNPGSPTNAVEEP